MAWNSDNAVNTQQEFGSNLANNNGSLTMAFHDFP